MTRGFLHGVVYGAVSAFVASILIPDIGQAMNVWAAFLVLDVISCVTFSIFVTPRLAKPLTGTANQVHMGTIK